MVVILAMTKPNSGPPSATRTKYRVMLAAESWLTKYKKNVVVIEKTDSLGSAHGALVSKNT